MTEDDKWKLHRRAEKCLYYKLDSTAIKRRMSPEQHTRFTELCDKYCNCGEVDILLTGYQMYGFMLIKLGVHAPRMTDEEADFVKNLFDNHMYKTVTYTRSVRV